MIRGILLTILIIEILFSISNNPAFAITDNEKQIVFKEATNLCKVFNNPCTIREVKSDRLGAQTRGFGDIVVTSKLLEVMDIDEVRGVLFHEVGHRVMGHVEELAVYLNECNYYKTCNQKYIEKIRVRNEYRADRFSVLAMLFTGKPEGLSRALIIITPPSEYYTTHSTHPSTADRIKEIDKILRR